MMKPNEALPFSPHVLTSTGFFWTETGRDRYDGGTDVS